MKTASFIISYNRPEMTTFSVMRNAGLTKNIFILVEDSDPKLDEYRKRFGEVLLTYHKPSFSFVDTCDLNPDLNTGQIAKFAAHEKAKEMGLDAFCVMDDDITKLKYRAYDVHGVLKTYKCRNFDRVFNECFSFLESQKLKVLFRFIMSGRMFPGRLERFERWCSHITFRRTCDVLSSNTRFYDDLSEAITNNRTGAFHFIFPYITYDAMAFGMQNNKGGSYESYISTSDYFRHFYLVIVNPDRPLECLPDKRTGVRFNRSTGNSFAQILREEFKRR